MRAPAAAARSPPSRPPRRPPPPRAATHPPPRPAAAPRSTAGRRHAPAPDARPGPARRDAARSPAATPPARPHPPASRPGSSAARFCQNDSPEISPHQHFLPAALPLTFSRTTTGTSSFLAASALHQLGQSVEERQSRKIAFGVHAVGPAEEPRKQLCLLTSDNAFVDLNTQPILRSGVHGNQVQRRNLLASRKSRDHVADQHRHEVSGPVTGPKAGPEVDVVHEDLGKPRICRPIRRSLLARRPP